MNNIIINGARVNNLKNINLTIPRNKLVCFIGVSGSGKSTLAFDIIAKEGQRQYFESLNTYSRRFLMKSNRPDVDSIEGISSSIIISQDRVTNNPRSTVGTMTEAYTYLRLLYSRVGLPTYDSTYYSFNHPYGACKKCKGLGKAAEVNIEKLVDMDKSLNEGAIKLTECRVNGMYWKIMRETEYYDMDKKLKDFDQDELNKLLYHPKELWKGNGNGSNVIKWTYQGIVTKIMTRNTKVNRGPSQSDLRFFDFVPCPVCHGWRLNEKSLEVRLKGINIGEASDLPIKDLIKFINKLDYPQAQVIKPRLIEQLQSLIDVGVGYLSLNRSVDTLSGGEAQRIKLARQLSCDLIETIYVLDEPTAGLHPKDIAHIIGILRKLQTKGNSVLIVEHDEQVIKSSDHIIEVGPGGGRKGGQITFTGSFKQLLADKHSVTSQYLRPESKDIDHQTPRQPSSWLILHNINKNNLKDLNLSIPQGVLTVLTGVSGAGKSSMVEAIVEKYPEGLTLIDQSLPGKNKRGCLATYTGTFDLIRKEFASSIKVSPSLFSFNSKGACHECKGLGYIDMDMNFLGDVKILCDQCHGKRYNKQTLNYKYRGKDISEILNMTAEEAMTFFQDSEVKTHLQSLKSVGLDYLSLGQSLDTLSGGERQRLKLASRLNSRGGFYILDEPTSGLHFADIKILISLINELIYKGNSVLVVEHNLEIIKNADWIIDLGPEGGDKGGKIVFEGTPSDLIKCQSSYTGQALKGYYES
jgi:excinuclease UvrABC ATPase subunit